MAKAKTRHIAASALVVFYRAMPAYAKRFLGQPPPIRAVLWDVYGTLLVAHRGDLDGLLSRERELRGAFEATIQRFRLGIEPAALHRGFLRAIAEHRADRCAAGIAHPEVRIEEIWGRLAPGVPAREIALYFEQHANPKRWQPDAPEILLAIRMRGLRQGIISNAQFYTMIELTDLLGADYRTVFDPELVFLSCDLGVAKPDPAAFFGATKALARTRITPAECLFIGDSPTNDIEPARRAGFRAVLVGPGGEIRHLREVLDWL